MRMAEVKEGAAGRFAGYQGCVWDGVTGGYGWDGGVRYQGFAGLARVGAELSGNIISNYRAFKCERSERTYNFDYVRGKRGDRRLRGKEKGNKGGRAKCFPEVKVVFGVRNQRTGRVFKKKFIK